YVGYIGDAFGSHWGYAGHVAFDLVDKDINDLKVTIEPGVEIPGEFKLDESAAASNPSMIGSVLWLHFIGMDGMPESMSPSPDPRYLGRQLGSGFRLAHAPQGRYRVEISPPASMYVSSARLGSQDILGQPVEIDENPGTIIVELSGSGAALE